MLQDALAAALQGRLRDGELEHAVLDEEMPPAGKRHRRLHVLAARLE
jgi:hypothetical protein